MTQTARDNLEMKMIGQEVPRGLVQVAVRNPGMQETTATINFLVETSITLAKQEGALNCAQSSFFMYSSQSQKVQGRFLETPG